MDTWVWHQVSLELCQINIQSTIKTQRSGDGGHNLGDQAVQVGVCWTLNVKIPAADVVDSFIIHHESAVGMLQSGVGC